MATTEIENSAMNTFNLINELYKDYTTKLAKVREWQKLLDEAVNHANNKRGEYEWSLQNKTASEIQVYRDALNNAYANITALTGSLNEAKAKADQAFQAYKDGKEQMLTAQEQAALEATLLAQANQIQQEANAAAAAAVANEASTQNKTASELEAEKRKKLIWTIVYWAGGAIGLGLLTWGAITLFKKEK